MVEVFESDLYAGGGIYRLPDGDELLLAADLTITAEPSDPRHLVTASDTLDRIAANRYAASSPTPDKWWWVIAKANSIVNPLDLSDFVGQTIAIPSLARILIKRSLSQP